MSADGDPPTPAKPLPKPPVARGSPEWRAMEGAKQRAYAQERRRYTEAWHRQLAGLPDEP